MSPTDVSTVTAANASFYTAVESADIDLLGAIWVEGASAEGASCVHPGWPALSGREAILRSFSVILANTPYIQFFLTDVDVRVTGDVGIVTCAENILTGVGGGPADADPSAALSGGLATATNVFRRTPTGWRLWIHHASPIIAVEGDESDEDSDDVHDEEADRADLPEDKEPDA